MAESSSAEVGPGQIELPGLAGARRAQIAGSAIAKHPEPGSPQGSGTPQSTADALLKQMVFSRYDHPVLE